MTYIVAAVVASGIFVAAGWRSMAPPRLASVGASNGFPADPLWDEPEIDLSASQSSADAGAAMRLALKRLIPVLRNHAVQAEIALPAGLMVRMRGASLTDLLEDLLRAAIQSAPASRMLLTAGGRGDGIYICITDDMLSSDLTVRMESVRSLKQRVAMRGGALQVDVRPREGTTLTLRLPAMVEHDRHVRTLPEHAREPAAAASIPSMGHTPQLR
jgi:hypothetical protein